MLLNGRWDRRRRLYWSKATQCNISCPLCFVPNAPLTSTGARYDFFFSGSLDTNYDFFTINLVSGFFRTFLSLPLCAVKFGHRGGGGGERFIRRDTWCSLPIYSARDCITRKGHFLQWITFWEGRRIPRRRPVHELFHSLRGRFRKFPIFIMVLSALRFSLS